MDLRCSGLISIVHAVEQTDQQSDSNVQVFVRIRPPLPVASDDSIVIFNAIGVLVQMVSPTSILLSGPRSEMFTYDQVGGPHTNQDQMFEWVGKPIVNRCIQGYNGTIFAYGQTGSGKTYTMQGRWSSGSANARYEGVIPRSLRYLFDLIEESEKQTPESQYICRGSYIEIYNEYVYDLLDPLQTHRAVREDIKRGVYVDGVTQELIPDHHAALKLFQRGITNRHVSETAMNRESSRSHAVFTLTIQSKVLRDGTFHLRESKLNMVDLAGSERQRDTRSDNARLKEAANINKSLLCLGGVINALSEIANGTQRHVAVVNQNMEEDVISLKQEITKLQQQLHSLRGRKLGGNGKLRLGPAEEDMISIRKLLKTALEKQQEAIQDRDSLKEQLEMAEDTHHQLQQQIELDQLLLNAKDSIISSASQENQQDAIREENELLKRQIQELQRQAEGPSELEHSQLENLHLQSKRLVGRFVLCSKTDVVWHLDEIFGLKASGDFLEMQNESKQQADYTNALSLQVINLISELNQSHLKTGKNDDSSTSKDLMQAYQDLKVELQRTNDQLRLRHEQVQFSSGVIKRQQSQIDALKRQLEQCQMTVSVYMCGKQPAIIISKKFRQQQPSSLDKANELQIELEILRKEQIFTKEKVDDTSTAQRMRILEIDNRLQSERKMRQGLEMQHIQEKSTLTSLIRRLEGENEKSVATRHHVEQELKQIIDESNSYRVQLSNFSKIHQASNQRLRETERRLKASVLNCAQAIESDSRFDVSKSPGEIRRQDHLRALETISMMRNDMASQIADLSELLNNEHATEAGLSRLTSQICNLTMQLDTSEDYDAILNKAEESTSLKTTVARLKAENAGMRELVETYKKQAVLHREREESLSMYRSQFSDHQQQQSALHEKITNLMTERDEAFDEVSALKKQLMETTHVADELKQLKQHAQAVEAVRNLLYYTTSYLSLSDIPAIQTNSHLIQHQNSRQKLQYHVKIKQENNELRAELSALKSRLSDQNYEENNRKKRRLPSIPKLPIADDPSSPEQYDIYMDEARLSLGTTEKNFRAMGDNSENHVEGNDLKRL
ncbi:hypothetical protein NQZ79_g183 [Umbelopsis isabellina]|nr:hypothetical protein NQZ79_g183 [Umbelopsis isabellina]